MVPTVTKVLSGEGRELDPKDGFIVQGCIFAAEVDKGQPVGCLVGNSLSQTLKDANVSPEVFTKEEMLKALMFTADELEEMVLTWRSKGS